MAQNDQEIADMINRLSKGLLSESEYWTLCRPLIESEVRRRRLPAKLYAPSSSGGSDWTEGDFDGLAADWVCAIRGAKAARLLHDKENASHVANAARLSIYRFTLGQVKAGPSDDLWNALTDVIGEFPSLISDGPDHEPRSPHEPFPWQTTERSARQRAVSADEVRDAINIIIRLRPHGWSKETLFNALLRWAGLDHQRNLSLNFEGDDGQDMSGSLPDNLAELADSRMIGEEVAKEFLATLAESEIDLLRVFIIPNGLGRMTLSDAAGRLGISTSTLHDRAKRLKDKLNTIQVDGVTELGPKAQEAFLSTLLNEQSGNIASDGSTE